MVLLDQFVEIFELADLDGRSAVSLDGFEVPQAQRAAEPAARLTL
jgi:hypothetical protein